MSDECGVCLGSYDYDGPCEFYDISWVKAKKQHRCEACRQVIEPGQKYNRFVGKFEGDMFVIKTCSDCWHIREAFTCEEDNHIPVEVMWETIHEVVFPQFTTACLAKVKDEHARETLRTKYLAWKGLPA